MSPRLLSVGLLAGLFSVSAAHATPRDSMAFDALPPAETAFAVGLRGAVVARTERRIEALVAEAEATAGLEVVRLAAMGHRYYPLADAPLVNAQSGVARRHFASLARRQRRHFPTIERALARQGLPDDLKYVAVIESALDPLAVSHAGAEGMWQFMPDTQADFGLDSLSVRDPAQATTAAARYLRRLGRMFDGDWQLALAAYNGGPGRVQRIARAYEAETGRRATFWAIRARLPRETQAYVPRWIATVELLGGRVSV